MDNGDSFNTSLPTHRFLTNHRNRRRLPARLSPVKFLLSCAISPNLLNYCPKNCIDWQKLSVLRNLCIVTLKTTSPISQYPLRPERILYLYPLDRFYQSPPRKQLCHHTPGSAGCFKPVFFYKFSRCRIPVSGNNPYNDLSFSSDQTVPPS